MCPILPRHSSTKDITFRPTIFDSDIKMLQNEYRQENENSSFIADFGLTTGYKPTYAENKKACRIFFKIFFRSKT